LKAYTFEKDINMKTILRIIVILFVASIVAGAFSLAVNNTSIASSGEGGQAPVMTDTNGQALQPMERPEGGDHDSGSITRGFSEVFGTVMKLSAITILILLAEKGMKLFNRNRVNTY
jgi:hypothetical protein